MDQEKEEAQEKDLYMSEGLHDMERVLETVPTKVTQAMNEILSAPYTQKEVKPTLFQMYPIKAPGSDGYPAHFFQHHWDTCGDDVTKAVLRIVDGTESAECINDTILVLIPKRNKAKKNQSCALKLDMMKAYDRVEWPYLKAIMLKLGFNARWVDIVMSLANSVGANEVYHLLDTYCQATGQCINHAKSSIYFIKGVPDSVRQEIKEALNIPNETLNEKYPGMPSDIGS
ncbi:uncharacterized protein [Aegilops tauschii subsp. strangulata]|uniref:uncharacterized protein n=1 Tax=Aegilops tauschii subsp. strangulata TaxID=200361 RepID=UPI003CC85BAC